MARDTAPTRFENPASDTDRFAGEDRPEGEPRILLFMRESRDRELLADTLGRRYDVTTTTDVESLDTAFDCCVFGSREFSRVAGTVQSKRDTDNAVFLPFVLLVGEGDADATDAEVREYVDDVIELPVDKAGLFARIGNLVGRRRTAKRLAEREAQLRRTVEDLTLKERAMDEAPVGITIADVSGGDASSVGSADGDADGERSVDGGGFDDGDADAGGTGDEDDGGGDNPLLYANEEFGAITGYGPEILGSDCRFLQGERTEEETVAEIREAIDAEEPVSVDILNYRKNGRTFWNDLEIAPIRDAEGRVTNYVGFQTEITERKIREQRLAVLNRVLSHNLRNTMSVIRGHADLLRGEYGEEPPPSLAEIDAAAEGLMRLADTVREIERTVGGGSSTPAAIDLSSRLDGLLSGLRDRYPAASIELDRPDDDPCTVAVSGIVAAIEEAIENAIKHNDDPEPSVTVRVRRPSPDWIDVEIEDDGPGIPDQEISALREGESSLNHAERLGLWLIYWVVNGAGGNLSVSESDPGGTLLTLSVPAAE